MKKLIYILFLLLTTFGYSQSGLGYVNYKLVRTHYGTGSTVQYPRFANSSADFDKMLDTNNPASTLISTGEVVSNSSQGFAGGNPPGVPGDYYVVEYTGWFYADLGGQYLFYSYSDDSAEVWVNGSVLVGKYNGPGTTSAWITLQAGTWYELKYRWQEYTGGAFGYLQVYGPKNGYFYPGGAGAQYQVSNQEPVYPHKLDVTYNINSSLDRTKFNSWVSYQSLGTSTSPSPLPSNGIKSYDSNGNGLDETLYPNGTKRGTTSGGSVEWGIIYSRDSQNRYRVGIDKREFPSGFDFTKLTQLQLFDLYDGPVTYYRDDAYWAEYYIYSETLFDWTGSSYTAYLRNGGSYQALKAEFSFDDITGFTPHDIHLGMDETYFTTTYPDMITIADVAKGFSQLTNQTDTPNGPQGGIFTSDVEFILGDVNNDNSFDFLDSQKLLQHLFADESPFANNTIDDSMFMFDGDYTNSTTSNWSIHRPSSKHFTHNLDENNKEQTKSIDVAFLGDLNFSHSSTLQSVNVSAKAPRTLSLSKEMETENVIRLDMKKEGNTLQVSLEIPNNSNNIIGTQFKLYFDEERLEYQDSEYSTESISTFSTKRNGYVNIGSFSADGSTNLNNGITYTLNFKLKSDLQSTLGLVSLGFSELVDKDGNQINYIIK